MDKQPVGTLPDLTQSNNDDEIMVITNSEYNQLKKEKISDFITDLTSTNENNALTKGTDGKMFVTDFGNASNITEGTLPTSVLPEIPLEKIPDIPKDKLPSIETSDLPVSGVTADTYAYPSSVTVNSQGQVTAIEAGEPGANNANQDLSNISEAGKEVIKENAIIAGEKHFLNKTQLTNCMLEAPNGIATYSGTTVTVQEGTNYLFPNGRNSNNTLQNTTFTAASNITGTMSGSTAGTFTVFATSESSLIFANNINYFITSTEPTALNDTTSQGVWYNPVLNTLSQCAATSGAPSWSTFEGARCATITYDGSTITAFNPVYPVELLKRSDKAEIVGWGMPDYDSAISISSFPYTVPSDGFVVIIGHLGNSTTYITVNDKWVANGTITIVNYPTGGAALSTNLFVSKGDVVKYYDGNFNPVGNFQVALFMPLKGVSNNA